MNKDIKSLPVTRALTRAYQFTFLIVALVSITSLTSLFFPTFVYPTEELRQSFLVNDIVNLLIVPLILLGSLWLTKRNKLIGLLSLPGALIYVVYNAIANLFGMPLGLSTLVYFVLVSLSSYTVFEILRSVDQKALGERLTGKVSETFSGWVLAVFGALFFLRALSELSQVFISGKPFSPEISADLLVAPLWVLGGVFLLRRKPLGYVSGLGLLFSTSMLFVGLLVFFILEPFVSGVPFRMEDFVVIFVMGMICFVPTGLFMRGLLKKDKIR